MITLGILTQNFVLSSKTFLDIPRLLFKNYFIIRSFKRGRLHEWEKFDVKRQKEFKHGHNDENKVRKDFEHISKCAHKLSPLTSIQSLSCFDGVGEESSRDHKFKTKEFEAQVGMFHPIPGSFEQAWFFCRI